MKNENTLEVGNNPNQESQGKWQTAIEMVTGGVHIMVGASTMRDQRH